MANYRGGSFVTAGSQAFEEAAAKSNAAAAASRQQASKPATNASALEYRAGKARYGSSSAWYDAAVKEQKDKDDFVKTLQKQLDYRKQNEWSSSIGGGIDELYGVKNTASEGVKTVEELEKELSKAQAELKQANLSLKYATEWRHYDADMEWLDNVEKSGQEWGTLSDTLGNMTSKLEAEYNEQLKAYTEAQQQNERIDLARRQGGVPKEVGYTYTSEEQLAKMYADLMKTGELRDMASRRYNYSLDELATDKQAVQRGQLMGQHLLDMDAQNAERNMEAYVQNHVKGDTLGALRESYRNDKSGIRPTDEWNDTQRNRYYVLLDRQGEQAANDYALTVNNYINASKEEAESKKFYDWGYAQDATWYGKTLRGLAGTAATVVTMPGELGDYINKVERSAASGFYVTDGDIKMHDMAHAITQGRADSLNELGTVGDKGLGDIYQLTNSMAQSLVWGNVAGSAGTLTLFFGAAANQGFDDAISRGASPEQAAAFGMLSGVAEAAAELVPLENLLDADKALTRGFLKSAMIQAGLEGLEEGETNVMNTLADNLVMGDKSVMNAAIAARMEQGESYEDAARAEWGNFVKDTVWSMLGGAISGAGSSAVQHGIVMGSKYKPDDNKMYYYGADAKTLGAEAAAVTDNKKLADLGKKVETKAEKGKSITNYTAKKLAEGTNRVSVVNATEQQVKKRVEGLSDKDARALANAIVSESRGEKNGPGNQKLIEKHREIADTLLKELGKDGEVAAWAREIGVRGMEAIKYGDRDINNMRQKLEEAKANIEADAEGAAEADMSASITIGDVSGVVQGMSIGNGKPQLILKNSEGTEQRVDVDEAIESGELPAGMARLAYESLGLGNAAADVYRLYKPGQNVTEYVAAMDEAISIAADVSKREAFDKSETVQELTEEQKDFAWSFGQQQRTEKQESRKSNKNDKRKPAEAGTVDFGGVTINGTTYKATTKDKIKAADLRVIERIAKAANINVVFYESDSIDGMYQGANGFYRDGTVYLDVHAAASKTTQQDAILLTAAHELTHHIRLNAEAQYDALKEFVVEHLLEQGMDFETMVQDKLKEKGMKRADAVEEVVADACEMVLKDSKAVEKLAKENKSLAQTIADWLHGFYEDIKAAFEGVEARSKEAKAMTDYMDELVKLWDDALIEASKGESKQSGKVKQSIRADFYTEFDAWDKKDPSTTFTIGTTSSALQSVGIKNQEIKLRSGTVLNKVNKHGNEGISFDTFRGIPELLEHPVLIQFSDAIDPKTKKPKYDDSITVIGDLYANGKPVMVALNLQPTNQKKTVVLDIIIIKSAYTKNALQNYINENTLLYIDPNKKRTNTWLSLNRLQLPVGENQYGSIRRISYDKNGVKVQNSKNKTLMQIALEKAGAVDEYGKPSVLSSDIRHSRRDSSEGLTKEEARAQAQAYTRLKAENAALQRKLEYWQGQTKRTKQRTISRGDVDKYAKTIVKRYGSSIDIDLVKKALSEMGDALVQNEGNVYGYLTQSAQELAAQILNNVSVEQPVAGKPTNAEDIVKDIKDITIHMSREDIAKLPEGFRKEYSGIIHISTKNGMSIEEAYTELYAEHGHSTNLFPQDITDPIAQIVMIADAYDTLTAEPVMYNPYASHMNEMSLGLAYDIMDNLLGESIRQTAPTFADKAEAKLQQQKADAKAKLDQVRADKNARIQEIRQQETLKRQEAVAKERAKKHENVAAVRDYYQNLIKDQREKRNESAAAKKYRDRAREKVNDLITLLRKNSDKEHIPEALKAPLIDFLTTLDFSSKQLLEKGKATAKDMKYADALEALERIAQGQQNYFEGKDNKDMLDRFLDMGDLGDVIRDHRDSVKAILEGNTDVETTGAIAYMNAAQLKDLSHILTVLTTSIRKLNKFHEDSHFASVIEAVREGMKAVDELGPEVEKILGADKAAQFLAWQNTIPYYAFKRFGEAGSERFEAFVMGWSKMAQNLAAIKKFAADTYSAEQVKAWESEVHEFNIRDMEFRMTTAQIMGLYCSEKREQAMNHLRMGGMRIGKIETKGKVLTKVIDQKQVINLTPSEILDVISTLTPEQVKVASELQKFMNTTCAAWGNEISMERFGYRQFTESNYYPIKVVDSNLDMKDTIAEETSLFRLLNMSMTKSLTPNANNSVVINSIFDVFATHTADMAKYNGLALPVLDMLKWYNYRDTTFSEVDGETHKQVKSMHKSIETAFGNAGTSYITNFMKDMNGAQSGGRDEGMLKGFMGRYKAAAVAFNARVVIQQPTSIVRAAYKINAKYLVQGATMSGGVEEAKNNSGLALWKSMGFFDTNVARGMTQQIKHAETAVDKIQDASMKAAEKADEITWGTIWNACKLEQKDKGLSGNALIEATTKRFNEIIVSTQVMDSTITRSDIMRNGSLMMKELTSFKAEPTVTYNMMLESMMELVLEYRRTKSWTEARKKAWPFMWRAGLAYCTSQIATAAAAAIVDALRDDDEYQDFIQKWLEHLEKNLKQGVNILNQLPIIGEAVNIALGKETHESMLFQPLTQLSKASTAAIDLWRVWFNSDKELNDPNRTNWGRLYQIGQAVSSLSGIPVAGGMREFKSLWNLSGGLNTGKKLRTYDSGAKNQIKYALLDKYITETEAVNLLLEVGEYENADDAYWAVQEWANADNSEWTRYNDVYAAIKAKDKNAFTAAQDALGDHGIAPKSVRAEAKRWIGRQFVGEEGIPASMGEKTALAALQDFAGLTKIEAQHLIDEWKFEKETGVRWADLKAEYVAGTFDKQKVQGYLINYGHEYSKDAAEKVLEWTCEKDTGVAFSDLCDAFIHGELTAEQTQKYLEKYGGETPADAAAKVAQWSLAPEFGIKYSSTDAGIKKALIEGYISDETAKAIMVTYGGKSWEEAEDYVNQYHFTEETGYSWSEIEEAYADGVIDYEEMVEWFTIASLDSHGSEEVAREYAEVAQWKKDIEGAEKINRTALDKWNTKGDYITRAGLDKVDFTDAWYLYSTSYSQYDAYGNKTKEKAQVFFEKLFALYQQGIYSEKEIDAIARTVYSKSYVNKYAMW